MDSKLRWDERGTFADGLVVEVRGDLVFPDSRLLAQRLSAVVRRGAHEVVLDLCEVGRIDAGIVGALLAAARQLRWIGGHLSVVTGDPRIIDLLATTGLDSVVDVAATQEDALGGMGRSPVAVGPAAAR